MQQRSYAPHLRADELRLLTVISKHYEQAVKQQEIAGQLRFSRPKVWSALEQARDQRIVDTTVVTPAGASAYSRCKLESPWGLFEVAVVEGNDWHLSQPMTTASQ